MAIIETEKALERFDNEKDIYLELIVTFLALPPPDFAEMRKELEKGRTAEAIHRMHQLKGAVLTLGAEQLAASASLLENGLRNGTGPELFRVLEQIEAEYPEVLRELAAVRDTLQKQP